MELKEENHRLKALISSFAEVSSSLDIQTVLLNSITTATKLMNAEIGSIALLNEHENALLFVESTDSNFDKLKKLSIPLGKGIAGSVAKSGISICVEDVHNDPRFYRKIDREMGRTTGSYICSPLVVRNKIIGTAQIMNRLDGAGFSQDDVVLLEGFASQAALAIKNAQFHQMELKQKSLEHEMNLCADIQQNIFPKKDLNIPGFDVYGSSFPAKEVGGDYYNYFVHNGNCCDLLIADVSGKGLSAALLVTQLHTCYNLLASAEKSLQQTVKELNDFFYSTLMDGQFITIFICRIYPHKEEIEYTLAGHPPPIFVRSPSSPIQEGIVKTGHILGLDKGSNPNVKKIPFFPGETIVAFSDGYSECQNAEGEFFGEDRMSNAVEKVAHKKDIKTIHFELKKEVDKFRGDMPFTDDTTLLLLRRIKILKS